MKPEIRNWLQNHYFSVAQPVLKNGAGIYPLILACQQGLSDVVHFLIDQNAALDVVDQYGNNALWAACYAENSDCIDALITAGVDINHQNFRPVRLESIFFNEIYGVGRNKAIQACPELAEEARSARWRFRRACVVFAGNADSRCRSNRLIPAYT